MLLMERRPTDAIGGASSGKKQARDLTE